MLMILVAAATMATTPASQCPDGMVCAWDVPSIVHGLQAAGYRAEAKVNDRGERFVASATNGNDFSIDLYTCDDDAKKTACKTMIIETWYAAKPYLTEALANAFNRKALFGRAYINDKGNLDLELAVAGDGGVPQAQFKAWIDWFSTADSDLDKLVDAAVAASKAPGKPA